MAESPEPVPEAERDYHTRIDPHRRGARLVDVILGGQDGVVNTVGVVLGVAAATGRARIVLAAGLAAAIAESVSMAAVAFTTSRAQGARYDSEHARELRHVLRAPTLERDEIREIYRRKGLGGELLERVVAALTSDREVWVAVMMTEEHGLAPVPRVGALRSAAVVGIAALVGSLVPLAPFLWLDARVGAWVALALAALVLFALGAYKAYATIGRPLTSGLELAAIGTVAALAGYVVGVLFKVPLTP